MSTVHAWLPAPPRPFDPRDRLTRVQVRHLDGEVAWGEYVSQEALDAMMQAKPFVPDGLQCWQAYREHTPTRGDGARRARMKKA